MSAPLAALRNSRGPGVRAFSTVTRTTAPTGGKKKALRRERQTVAFSAETDGCTSARFASRKSLLQLPPLLRGLAVYSEKCIKTM